MKCKTLVTVGSILGEKAEDRPGECPTLDGVLVTAALLISIGLWRFSREEF